MPDKKLPKEVIDSIYRQLSSESDSLYQLTQIKAIFRLLRDEDGINKDSLALANSSLNEKINELLIKVTKVTQSSPHFIRVKDVIGKRYLKDNLFIALRNMDIDYHVEGDIINLTDLIFHRLDSDEFAAGNHYSLLDETGFTAITSSGFSTSNYFIYCWKCDKTILEKISLSSENGLIPLKCHVCNSLLLKPTSHIETEKSVEK